MERVDVAEKRLKSGPECTGSKDWWRPRASKLAAERAVMEVEGRNWSARHVADLVDLSELTVKRMARRGQLPAVKVGRDWQFPPAKVRAWLAGAGGN